jgi:hypothetical protein
MPRPVSPLALALPLVLAACGGSGEKASPPPSQSPALAAASDNLCNGLPDFVSIERAEVVGTCSMGETQPGHVSGTVAYVTRDAPEGVIAFYKGKAAQAGIPADVTDNSSDGITFLARDDKGRSLMAYAAPRRSGGSDVTVNWGYNK